MSASPVAAQLRRRLAAARRRLTGASVARGALVTAGVLAAALLLAVGAEAAVWLGVELRTAVFWALVLALLGMLAALVAVPLLRGLGVLPGLDERAVIRRADRDHAGVGDRLATLLDLADGHDAGDDQKLHAAALDALGREVEGVPFERVHAFGPVREAARWAVVPLALLALGFVVWPQPMSAAASRLMAPGEYFAPPAPFQLAVTPGDAEVTRGAPLTVSALATGRELPVDAELEVGRADERATETVRLRAEGGRFAHALDAVRADTRYRFVTEGVRTPWFTLTAVDRPLVRGVQVTVAPPSYAGRPSRALPEGVGDVTGLVGSTVRVTVTPGGPAPVEAWLRVEWAEGGSQRVPLRLASEAAVGAFRLRGAGTYTVHLRSADGLENTAPARYRLGALGDGPPQIALVEGSAGALSEAPRRLVFRATDDFGFRSGRMVYRLTRDGRTSAPRALPLGLRSRPLDQDVALDWRVPGAQPGDVVEFYGTVTDNGPGGQSARTPLFTLRFPSFTDRLDAFDAQRDSTADALDELREDAEESGERFRQLREELREEPDPDWEDRRQVEELLREQDALQNQARQLQEQMQRMTEQLDPSVTSEALQRQFEAMQQVMQELETPELRDALDRLREAMEQLDMREMLEQTEQAAVSEEELRRRLDRAMELMERLEAAVEMEEIARRAEDLAELEERLAEETEALREEQPPGEQGDPDETATEAERDALADQQREAAEAAEALDEQLDELREQLEGMDNAPTDAVEEMQEQMRQDGGLQEQMEQNAEQLQQNQLQDAQQGQQDLSEQLRQMASDMRDQSQQMQGEQQQIDMAALRRALEDVLTISRDQEALAARVQDIPDLNPALVPAARTQGELRDALRTVVDSLRRVARTVPQLGPEIDTRARNGQREMGFATEQLAERRAARAAGYQRTAMTHLNELALLLADLLEQLQNQSSANGGGGGGSGESQGGMSQEQLRQMGQAQQQLNQRIQQMLNESAGERLSPEEGQRLRQMAEQQEALRRSLERGLEQGGAGLDPRDRSALQRVEEEMRRAAEQLRNGALDTRTPPRQQQILERLLQAERSVNQRGQEQRREAQRARDRPAPPVSSPRIDRPADRIRGDLIRALESGYAPDYQDLIKRYFERLQARTADG